MATYLLDTNAISDALRGLPAIASRIAAAATTDRVVTCTIVRGEVMHGLKRMPDGAKRLALQTNAEILFGRIPCEALGAEVADAYATLKHVRQTKGLPMDENDLWIAATAIAQEAVLITRDADFSGTPGLLIEDWTK